METKFSYFSFTQNDSKDGYSVWAYTLDKQNDEIKKLLLIGLTVLQLAKLVMNETFFDKLHLVWDKIINKCFVKIQFYL